MNILEKEIGWKFHPKKLVKNKICGMEAAIKIRCRTNWNRKHQWGREDQQANRWFFEKTLNWRSLARLIKIDKRKHKSLYLKKEKDNISTCDMEH